MNEFLVGIFEVIFWIAFGEYAWIIWGTSFTIVFFALAIALELLGRLDFRNKELFFGSTYFITSQRIHFSKLKSEARYRTISTWEVVEKGTLLVATGRIIRFLDMNTKKYFCSFFHRSFVLKAKILDSERIVLLCFDNIRNDEIGCFLDIIQNPLNKSNKNGKSYDRIEIKSFKSDFFFHYPHGEFAAYMIVYGNRYVDIGFCDGFGFVHDTLSQEKKQYKFFHDDHKHILMCGRAYRFDENILGYSIGKTIYTFPNFNTNRCEKESLHDIEFDRWNTGHRRSIVLSSFFLPLREFDSLIPREFVLSSQFDEYVERLSVTNSRFRTKAIQTKRRMKKGNQIDKECIFATQFYFPPEEHNSLVVCIMDSNIVIFDVRKMILLEAFILGDGRINTVLNLQPIVHGNQIFYPIENRSEFHVITSKVLCDTQKLEKRVDDVLELINHPIISNLTRVLNRLEEIIFEFPTSLMIDFDRTIHHEIIVQSSTGKEIIIIKIPYDLRVPKRKLYKIFLGYRVELTSREKVQIYCFFRGLGMKRRMWALLQRIQIEDKYSITRLKEMYILISHKIERFNEERKKKKKKRKERLNYITSLACSVFIMLIENEEFKFLKKFDHNASNIRFRDWLEIIKKASRKFRLESHDDFLGIERETLSNTQLKCTIWNIRRNSKLLKKLRNITIKSKEGKKPFKLHIEILLGRSITLNHLLKEKMTQILSSSSNNNTNNNNGKRKKRRVEVHLEKIPFDVDLFSIVGSCYERDVRPMSIRRRFGDFSLSGLVDFSTRDLKSRSKVIQIAEIYKDSDLFVDYQHILVEKVAMDVCKTSDDDFHELERNITLTLRIRSSLSYMFNKKIQDDETIVKGKRMSRSQEKDIERISKGLSFESEVYFNDDNLEIN